MPSFLHAAAIASIMIAISSVVLSRVLSVLVEDRGKRTRRAGRSRHLT
jgi:hypothetical protein